MKSIESIFPRDIFTAYIFSILSGVFLGFAFPPFDSGYLAFVAFLPLLLSIEFIVEHKVGKIIPLLYTTYFIFQGIANWWVGSWQAESDPFLMLAGIALQLGHPFFLMLPFLCYMYIRKRTSLHFALISLPIFYISYEWLHSLTDASYPWLSLGYMMISIPSISQLADLIGVFGLSFFIIMVNVLIFMMIYNLIISKKIKNSIVYGSSTFALLLSTIMYGNIKIHTINSMVSGAESIEVGIVQPNINPWKKWSGGVYGQLDKHIRLMKQFQTAPIDLWIWSETAVPFYDIAANVHHDFRSLLKGSNNTPLLTGFAELQLVNNDSNDPLAKPFALNPEYSYVAYNAAGLIQANQKAQVHRKMKLTPFGEGFPFSQDYPWLAGLLEWGVGISGWKKGVNQLPLEMESAHHESVSIGTVICIESIYPEFVSQYSKKQATMLSVITNDAWFDGSPGPMQHFAISQMRAIENHKAIARCGNTGVSGIIYPDGSIHSIADPETETVVVGTIPQLSILTVYAQYGDMLPRISSVVSFMLLCFVGYLHASKGKE